MESLEQARAGRIHNRDLAFADNFHDINWQHYSHPQLYDMIKTADPGFIKAQSGQWAALGEAIDTTTRGVGVVLAGLFGTWQGDAAETAKVSNAKLDQWATDMNQRTHQIGARLGEYSDAVEVAQRRMPPPEFAWAENAYNQDKSFTVTSGPSEEIEWAKLLDDQKPDFDKHHQNWLEAVRVMSEYGQQSQGVHDAMPPAYEPGPTTGQTSAPVIPKLPPGEDPPIVGTIPDPIQPGKPGGTGVPGDIDGDGIPDGTTPGGYQPSGTGPGTGYGVGVTGPGGGSGADLTRGGAGGGFAGVGGLAAGGGGLSGAGGPGARGGAAAGLAGARGAAGASGYPPFGAGGAGAQGEEDAEHKDKYTEGLDLFDDLPPAYPPVFGA